MKLIMIAFTENGLALAKRVERFLKEQGHQTALFVKSKYITVLSDSGVQQVTSGLREWANEWIPGCDGVIFIGAAGIAIRTMAPFVKDKRTDPAVVVLDEKGQFSIPLLSGHLGGANELARGIAEEIGSTAVITTATDVNHHFAVDVFAKKNHLWISDMKLAKEVSALVLRGEKLPAGAGAGYVPKHGGAGICELEFPIEQKETAQRGGPEMTSPDGKRGTFWIQTEKNRMLHLVPKKVTLGIGCRKGTSCEAIEKQVDRVLREQGIFRQAVSRAASIDLKKEEPGLLAFCEKWELPLEIYTGEELRQAEGNFTPSAFVNGITGVDNVCERSAVLGSRQGTLLVKKQAQDGVTVACAIEDWSVDFE
ncbi:MAG: cobalt-precorrin 5A hydrolase [Clostridiales bacterium]|nr:cobalt-precorrin 5A hydrolase [Clostridiales bacterium]